MVAHIDMYFSVKTTAASGTITITAQAVMRSFCMSPKELVPCWQAGSLDTEILEIRASLNGLQPVRYEYRLWIEGCHASLLLRWPPILDRPYYSRIIC
jgi:hypothetical protein